MSNEKKKYLYFKSDGNGGYNISWLITHVITPIVMATVFLLGVFTTTAFSVGEINKQIDINTATIQKNTADINTIETDISDIKSSISSIDGKLEILVDDYKSNKNGGT